MSRAGSTLALNITSPGDSSMGACTPPRSNPRRASARPTAAQEHGLVAVGVNNNTNFLRSMTEGRVTVDARAIQQGRTQQLWEVRITDDHARLIATGQVRLQNITPRP